MIYFGHRRYVSLRRAHSSGVDHPTNIMFQVTGNNLTLNWPAVHTGCQLQVQTHSTAQGLGTNWFNVADSSTTNQITVPINTANGCVFYRLIYP